MARERIPAPEVYINVDLTALFRIKASYEKRSLDIWRRAAERHRQYLFKRFIALSAMTGGSNQWQKLAEETVKSKEKRKIAPNARWILREGSVLLRSLGFIVKKDGYFVGYVRDRSHPRSQLSVIQLADVHHKGIAREGRVLPRRPVVVLPDRRTYRDIVNAVQREFSTIIAEVNRSIYTGRRK